MLGVVLGGFGGVVRGVVKVTLFRVGVMCCRLVVTRFVMLGRFAVMTGGVLVVLSCLEMVLCCLLRHVFSLRNA